MRCYCSICRKTAGAGGYGINLGGDSRTLRVQGQQHVKVYRAKNPETGKLSEHQRHFCAECGSHLWACNSSWPELVHPVAGAIDTPLPPPPESVHIMVKFRVPWAPAPQEGEAQFAAYPDQSLASRHQAHGYEDK